MRALPILLLTALGAAPAALAAQEPVNVMHGIGLARRATAGGDHARAVAVLQSAGRLSPGHPVLLLELARAQVRAGQPSAARQTLRKLSVTGLATPLSQDSVLARLPRDAAFDALRRGLAAAAAPRVRSDTALVLTQPDLIPEALAVDARTGSTYVGSMGLRKVVRTDRGGTTTDFVPAGADGPGEVLGIRIDPVRAELWVNHWTPDPAAPANWMGRRGWAAVDRYALADGKRVQRYVLRDTAGPHLFNDIAFTPGGDAYITDSDGGRVYRVRGGGPALEVFYAGARDFVYPNGIVFDAARGRLLVAHVEGISALSLAGDVARLATDEAAPTGFIDGLYTCGGRLVAIQNVADFPRVVELTLDAAGTRVTRARVLEQRHPAYDAPTTGAVVGDDLLYIASSRLRRIRPDGSIDPSGAGDAVILRLPLGRCR